MEMSIVEELQYAIITQSYNFLALQRVASSLTDYS